MEEASRPIPTAVETRVLPRPPLHIVILHHPESDPARVLAKAMYKHFANDPSGRRGLRIPISYAPDHGDGLPPADLNWDAADHTLAVVLVDRRMTRRVKKPTAAEWGAFLVDALSKHPEGSSPHHVLPVGLDDRSFDLDERLGMNSFVRLDVIPADDLQWRIDELAFQIAVRALHLLQKKIEPDAASQARLDPSELADQAAVRPVAPLEMFISHAKVDLPPLDAPVEERNTDPVLAILVQLAEGPVDGWYDAKKIPPGGRFDQEINEGVLGSSAVVCVMTDRYATREWCRREVLESKGSGRPMVVVDALASGETRNFPYLGNVPTVRWRDQASDARTIVGMAIREALRYQHNLAVLLPWKQPDDLVIGTTPELLTVGLLPRPLKRLVYPDPPLGREEIEIIEQIALGAQFVTPLADIAARPKPAGFELVGLSLSGSTDIQRFGLDSEHLGTLADDLCLYLLVAGLKLAYGGQINHEGDKIDDENFAVRLFGLVRSYSPLAKEIGGALKPIVNYVGWPIHLRFGDDEYDLYGREAELLEIDPPDPLGVELELLELDDHGWCPPKTAAQRFAWGRCMTAMREQMTADIDARIVIGGKLDSYVGIYPGVLEEALLMLRAKKPLYLIGAFGGAARLVIDLLENVARNDFSTAELQKLFPETYDATLQLYGDAQVEFSTPEQLHVELKQLAAGGLAAALGNGLDDGQNRNLFYTTDPRTMVELILQGMSQLS